MEGAAQASGAQRHMVLLGSLYLTSTRPMLLWSLLRRRGIDGDAILHASRHKSKTDARFVELRNHFNRSSNDNARSQVQRPISNWRNYQPYS